MEIEGNHLKKHSLTYQLMYSKIILHEPNLNYEVFTITKDGRTTESQKIRLFDAQFALLSFVKHLQIAQQFLILNLALTI